MRATSDTLQTMAPKRGVSEEPLRARRGAKETFCVVVVTHLILLLLPCCVCTSQTAQWRSSGLQLRSRLQMMAAAILMLSFVAISPVRPHDATLLEPHQQQVPPEGQAMERSKRSKPDVDKLSSEWEGWGSGPAAAADRWTNSTAGSTSMSIEPKLQTPLIPIAPLLRRRSLSALLPASFQALGFHSESHRSIIMMSHTPQSPASMMPNLGKWVPKMARGLVAKQAGKVPATQQCWAPLCKACKVPQPSPGALGGLRVFVLSHAGKSEGPVRQTIRQTWGARAVELGAKVEFVVSENLQQWGKPLAKALQEEKKQNGDIRLVRITDFDNNTVEDGYQHLAYKVYSYASAVAPEMGPETWLMKLDSDTYMNPDRLALDIAEFRKEAKISGGAWQYAGYFNNGEIQVKTSYGRNKGNKGDAWVEKEYGAKNSHYPPYAFGAAGWVLGYDALQEMLRRGRDPSVLRPKGASEDAMVGVLLEDCSRCIQKRWENNQILGGTHFPFASLIRRHGCPSLFERIGMAVADKELPSFRCFLTITELKKASYIRAMSNIVKSAAVNSPPGDKEVNLCDGASARVGRSVSQPTRLML